jgi:hypothetical protein
MADITLTKEVLTKIINDNPSSTFEDIFNILINDKNNTYRTVVSSQGTGGGILKRLNTLTYQIKNFELENKLVQGNKLIGKYDPKTMKDLGRYLEGLYESGGKFAVGGKFQKRGGENNFYNLLDRAVKNAQNKDSATFPINSKDMFTGKKVYDGEKLYNAIRLYGDTKLNKSLFPRLRKSSRSWANFEGKGLIGPEQLQGLLKQTDGYNKGTIVQYLVNAQKKPTANLSLKQIEIAKRFIKTLDEAGAKLIPRTEGNATAPNAFNMKNADLEKLAQIGKLAPTVSKSLRNKIVRFSKASEQYAKLGGAADFKRLRDTTTALREILQENFGSKINTNPELVKSQLLDFLDNNKMLKNQLTQDFDGKKFFKRNLGDLTAKDLFRDMMPDIDHAKTIKQISENFNKGDAGLSETMFNKTLASSYFNKSLKNKLVNSLVSSDYDPSLVADIKKNLTGTGGIIKGKGTEFIGDPLNPIISKQVERMGYSDLLQKGAPELTGELKTQSDFYKNLYKDISQLPKGNRRLIETAVGCTINRAEGGRINMVEGGSTPKCVEIKLNRDPEGFMKKVASIEETSGPINKIKNAASKFLSVAKKGGRFGAFAAVGAAAGAVKQFMSDDPTSYLSDENQQKNMLIDMVTEPVMDERDPGITSDAQLPVLGAVTAAGAIPGGAEYYKDRRGIRPNDKFTGPMQKGVGKIRAAASPISGLLGKGLAATGTPLGMLALEPLYIGSQLAAGDSVGEIATNPINYLGAAFASPLTQQATKFASPAVSNIMRLGISPTALKTVSRRFGLPGLALSAGISGYEMYRNKREGRGLFDDG